MKVAIVHDYLIDFGGAERVLVALHEMYPEAPIYTSIYRPMLLGKLSDKFSDAKIIESWFGKLPYAQSLISPFRFLLPLIWNSFDLKEYDLIISSSSWAITKGFPACRQAGTRKQIEICYCHTPPRYLYGYDTSRKFTGILGKLVWFYGLIVNHFMRMYDFKSAQNVNYFIANSKEVQNRIQKFYRRDSTVIYPPIETPEVSIVNHSRGVFYLTGGRLVSAKNFDLIIKAFNKLKLPLKVYGTGVLENELKSISNSNIEFLGKVSDQELNNLYAQARAFVVAQKDEDFGMTLVEAQAQGCPVIAYRGGGYLESIIENKTGMFFNDDELIDVIKKFEKMKFNPNDCIKNAKKFSKDRFKREMGEFIRSIFR